MQRRKPEIRSSDIPGDKKMCFHPRKGKEVDSESDLITLQVRREERRERGEGRGGEGRGGDME
jgi:hypothetical protein